MEALPQGLKRWMWVVALGIAGAGCTPLGKLPSMTDDTPKPSANCCQTVVTWSNKVHMSPAPSNGGSPSPCIVGRLYLFGPTIDCPLVGDGSIQVDLFDDSGPKTAEQPLERWYIDPDTLHRLLARDIVGWGYTLVLPWTSCKHEITRVHLTVRYDPKHGSPLYTPSSSLTLEHPASAAMATFRPESSSGIPPIGPPAVPVPPVRR